MNIRFQKAEIKDLDKIETVFKAVVRGMQNKGIDQWDEEYPNREVLKEDIEKGELYIGRIGEEISSAFVLNQEVDEQYSNGKWKYPAAEFYTIHRFCVNPKFQGQGIGKKTMKHIEDFVLEKGVETIRMDTFSGNPYALGLYQNFGYEITGEAYWRKGTFYLLEKNIKVKAMTEEFRMKLQEVYDEVLMEKVEKETESLSIEQFFRQFETTPDWAIGPMEKIDAMTFKKNKQWEDPTETGWKSGFLFNPSLIEKDGKLYLFYRAAPKIETLCSRIGLAVYEESTGWKDYEGNPVVFPMEEDEVLGVEDPKVYKAGNQYIMFYNGVAPVTEEIEKELKAKNLERPGCVCTIKAMVSEDLLHWTRIGQIVPTEISCYWAKGAVIPKNPKGEAVKIQGKYIMYLSEGCGGKQVVGYSEDMIHWEFEEQKYLDISEYGRICEVACAVTDYTEGKEEILLDVFYFNKEEECCGLQVKYFKQNPYKQIEINKGATLSWGGLIQYKDKWLCAQGWDALPESEEIYLYGTGVRR